MTEEEIASQNDVKGIQKFSKRLSNLLIKPYFKTEVIEEVADKEIAQSDIEICDLVNRYLKNPQSEEETFIATSQLKVHQVISDYSI